MFNIDPDCGGIEGLVLFEGFIDKILIEGFPLDAIQGFVNRDFNIAKDRESLDDVGDQGSGQVIIDNLVIRSKMRINLLFPEHAVSDIHIGSCDTRENPFFNLRTGIVELEFRKFPVFFPEFVPPEFCKTDRFPVEKLYSLTGEM